MRAPRHAWLLVLCLLAGPGSVFAGDPPAESDREVLLDGVREIGAPGIPGPICVFGPRAFPVVCGGRDGLSVVAAARWAKGRVVAFGHGGYFSGATLEVADTSRLMQNAVRWASSGARPRVVVLQARALAAKLETAGFASREIEGGLSDALSDADVLCADAARISSAEDAEAVARFVRRGGGWITAGLGWGWLQLHPGGDLLRDMGGNPLLAEAGLVIADGTLDRTSGKGYRTDAVDPDGAHAGLALERLVGGPGEGPGAADRLRRAAGVVTHAIRTLPRDDEAFRPRLEKLASRPNLARVPRQGAPLRAGDALARVLLAFDLERRRARPAREVGAQPSAEAFPGAVPAAARRVRERVVIPPGRRAEPRQGPYANAGAAPWISTGLYAAPGDVVTVEVPEEAAHAGLALRIGAHTDRLWDKAEWRRAPDVSLRVPLEGTTSVASPFGGLVYVEAARAPDASPLELRISGAVRAPRFVLDRTTLEDWRKTIRREPAPWAELETTKVILTIPSEAVRELDDPEPALRLWDRVLDACADLSGRARERAVPERYVADVQISAGSMHSGYPIMTHLDAVDAMIHLPEAAGRAKDGAWGLFHEMGHNHQAPEWTFDGTTEVTCNLFTLYVLETVAGRAREEARPNFPPADDKIRAYLDSGPDFARWKREPFLALTMYFQLIQAFGWEPFRAVFAAYRRADDPDRPRSDADKRDQWMLRMSRAVERDLGPFFEAWGVPTSPEARARVASLPRWMPEGFPPP